MIETVCVASYHDYKNQTELKVLKDIAPNIKAIGDGKGKGVLVVDDLTDTGKTARVVRDAKYWADVSATAGVSMD